MDREENTSGSAEMTRTQPAPEGRHPDSQGVAGRPREHIDETRRSLVRAGWVLPAVMAVQLQTATDAFASSVGIDSHVDASAHVDAGGAHVDAGVGAHVDA
jgi:CxxC motif-containing protein (DUF1111 family)